jgi:hypothetical protein
MSCVRLPERPSRRQGTRRPSREQPVPWVAPAGRDEDLRHVQEIAEETDFEPLRELGLIRDVADEDALLSHDALLPYRSPRNSPGSNRGPNSVDNAGS